MRNLEYHVPSVLLLDHFLIHLESQLEVVRVPYVAHRHEATHSEESVLAFAHRPRHSVFNGLGLHLRVREVNPEEEPFHMVEPVLRLNVATCHPDKHTKFHFMMDFSVSFQV